MVGASSLVGKVKFVESFVKDDCSAVIAEFHCRKLNPSWRLRIIDRFTVNEKRKIVEQENFFDPGPVTNPGTRG